MRADTKGPGRLKRHTKKTCVHLWNLSTTGRCEGCLVAPLSPNLPDPKVRGQACPDD